MRDGRGVSAALVAARGAADHGRGLDRAAAVVRLRPRPARRVVGCGRADRLHGRRRLLRRACRCRRFLRGEATRPLSPLRAMRTLVLAQAAALTGALVAGWYAAQALVLLPDADVDSVRAAMLRSLARLRQRRADDRRRPARAGHVPARRPGPRPDDATGTATGPRPGPLPGPRQRPGRDRDHDGSGPRSHRPVAPWPLAALLVVPLTLRHPQRQHRGRRRRGRGGRPARRRVGRTVLARAAPPARNASSSPTADRRLTGRGPAVAGYLSTSPTTKNIEPRMATMSAIRLPGSTSASTCDVVERRRAQLEPPRRLLAARDQVVAVEARAGSRSRCRRAPSGTLQHLGQPDVDRARGSVAQPVEAGLGEVERDVHLLEQHLEPGQAVAGGAGHDAARAAGANSSP